MMFKFAIACMRNCASSRSRDTRFIASSRPQFPPRAITRTPFTDSVKFSESATWYSIFRMPKFVATPSDVSLPTTNSSCSL